MDSLSFLGPILGFASVAVIVLAIVAIVQDIKQERKFGYRQAFYTIVTLVMLVMTVGSLESLMVIGMKEALPAAKQYSQRYNQPPSFFFSGSSNEPIKPVAAPVTSYACEKDCQFTAGDKQAMTDWKTNYLNWRETENISQQTRRNIAGALSLLLIALPLFFLFWRWMNRGAKEEFKIQGKPSPLRSIYFYGISFAGLVTAVVGGAFLLNTGLNAILKTNSSNSASKVRSIPAMELTSETGMVDSIVACGEKCSFSAEDIQLAKDWKVDWVKYRELQNSNAGTVQNDLANTIPLILVGLPLFWFHFTRIRREGHDGEETLSSTPPAV